MAELDHVALAQNLVTSGKMTIQQGNDALKAHGINQTLAESTPPSGEAPNTEGQAPIEVLDPVTKRGSLTAEQVHSAYENWCKLGLDPAKFEEAARADGFELVDDEKSEAETAHDAKFGFDREHQPDEYKIDYKAALKGKTLDPAGLAAFNSEATEFLSDLQIEPALGGSLVSKFMETGQRVAAMKPEACALWQQEQRAILLRTLGSQDNVDAAVARAAKALKLAGPSAFVQRLIDSHALDDAWTMATLANHGARIEEWAEKYPEKKK